MRRSAIAVALFCLGLQVSAAVLEPPKPNEQWITFTVDEFQFISDASPERTLAIARSMLQMRAAVGQATNLEVRSKRPMKVFLFADQRRFTAYRDALLERKSKHVGGMFASGDIGNFIILPAEYKTVRVIYHELTHYLVQNTMGEVPLWFKEGIADYYSTFSTDGRSMQIGHSVPEHLLWLRNGSLIPLQELFNMTSDSRSYSAPTQTGEFYAQSWALLQYLLAEPGRRAQLARFLALLDDREYVDPAFTKAFATTYAQLEEELRAFVLRSVFHPVTIPLGETPIAELPAPEPMPRHAVLFELGHLLAQAGGANTGTAERFLRQSLAMHPHNASAHAGLGMVYEILGRRAEADAEYAAALKFGSDDPNVVMQAALGLAARNARNFTGPVPREDILKVRELFRCVTQLDPTRADAWAGIGRTYLGQKEDLGPGIAALEKSLALARGETATAFLLASLYIEAGRPDDGAKMFDGPDPATTADRIKAHLDAISPSEKR